MDHTGWMDFIGLEKIYMIHLGVEFPPQLSKGCRHPAAPASDPSSALHPEAAGASAQEAGSLTVDSPAPQLCGELAKKELWVTSLLWSGCHGNKLSLISSVVTMAIF